MARNGRNSQLTQSQKHRMSGSPGGGARNLQTLGRDGAPTAVELAPDEPGTDRKAIAFGREGAGLGTKG